MSCFNYYFPFFNDNNNNVIEKQIFYGYYSH